VKGEEAEIMVLFSEEQMGWSPILSGWLLELLGATSSRNLQEWCGEVKTK